MSESFPPASESFPSFDQFFESVWGHQPHRWQTRLAEQVLQDGRWPEVIDLPTGSGKTAALDIAVYALARQPGVFPRRVVFVVDRRLIVDQTAERAEALAARLVATATSQQPDDEPARRVGDVLRQMSSTGLALDVGRLRGGSQNRKQIGGTHWLKWPDQPAVIVSTVDQFGSRLLFRGYGVTPVMEPIYAGLAGNDCLVLLDEVQLSTALAETLVDLQRELEPVRGVPYRWQSVQMSATPVGAPSQVFGLEPDEDLVPGSMLATSTLASKPARLKRVGRKTQASEEAWRRAIGDLVEECADAAEVVGIVVNRVASARAIAEALGPRGNTMLLTGRMRPYDRRSVEAAVVAAADPDRSADVATTDPVSTIFVVATQCIEVGADLSFDAMITEVCPRASLMQRFGRLDRRGKQARSGRPAQALIVGIESTIWSRIDDPVYGPALRATWEALDERFGGEAFDVGAMSADMRDLGVGVDVEPTHPAVLLPSHLDSLSHTLPAAPLAPDVAPFLHGFGGETGEVSIVWRADVDVDDPQFSEAALRLLPPMNGERLNVPIAAVRSWLRGWRSTDIADIDVRSDVVDEPTDSGAERRALRWRRHEDQAVEVIEAAQVRAGDAIVVPTSYGGLGNGVWDPDSITAVDDIAALLAAEDDRPVLRIGIDILKGRGHDAASVDDVMVDDDVLASIQADLADELGDDHPLSGCRPAVYGSGRLRWAVSLPTPVRGARLGGDDDTNSFIGAEVPLDDHLAGVGEIAYRFAASCGLPARLCDDFRLAGELHDVGKADRRFQIMLYGDEIAEARGGGPIAKSRQRRRGFSGGYPQGMRHEFMSVELLSSTPEALSSAHDPDLVTHLVTTHHGRARPLPQHVDDASPVGVEHRLRSGVALAATSTMERSTVGPASLERFWRLIDRYGWHGLAWLEAVFRLADHRRSEMEESDDD